MSFLPPNHSNGNGNGRKPSHPSTNGNGRSPEEPPQIPLDDRNRDFNPERSDDQKLDKIPTKLDVERVRVVKQQMNRLYMILVVVGLTIGLIVSAGVVTIIQRLGLTEVVPIGEPDRPPDQ